MTMGSLILTATLAVLIVYILALHKEIRLLRNRYVVLYEEHAQLRSDFTRMLKIPRTKKG